MKDFPPGDTLISGKGPQERNFPKGDDIRPSRPETAEDGVTAATQPAPPRERATSGPTRPTGSSSVSTSSSPDKGDGKTAAPSTTTTGASDEAAASS